MPSRIPIADVSMFVVTTRRRYYVMYAFFVLVLSHRDDTRRNAHVKLGIMVFPPTCRAESKIRSAYAYAYLASLAISGPSIFCSRTRGTADYRWHQNLWLSYYLLSWTIKHDVRKEHSAFCAGFTHASDRSISCWKLMAVIVIFFSQGIMPKKQSISTHPGKWSLHLLPLHSWSPSRHYSFHLPSPGQAKKLSAAPKDPLLLPMKKRNPVAWMAVASTTSSVSKTNLSRILLSWAHQLSQLYPILQKR